MLPFLLLFAAPALLVAAQRVRLNPSGVSVTRFDPEFTDVWNLPSAASASATFGGVKFDLSVPGGSVLKGSRYKFNWNLMPAYLGERTVSAGVSTDTTTGQAITLKLSGLSSGSHSLVTFHNAWDNLSASNLAPVRVTVNGNQVISSLPQTVRQSSLWNSASSYVTFNVGSTSETVTIVFSPASTSVSDKRILLNGFDLDMSDTKAVARQPSPGVGDLHVQDNNGVITLSWNAPSNGAASYNVFVGTNGGTLNQVATKQTGRTYALSSVTAVNTYQWRVDAVTSSGAVVKGRPWHFRPAVLAFPGAEGYGRFATGGRGGRVVKVTKLTDDGSAGTLRHALNSITGPRIVVFDVGGEIKLKSRLTINTAASYVTVAGQTAPGKGIVVTGYPFGVSGAEDVVIRHIRTRPGTSSGQTMDGMGLAGGNYCIMDRCSISWTIDESFSSRGAFNVTLQRTMIAEPLNVAGHQNYPAGTAHGYAATIGGNIGSFHHNLIAHAEGRSWSLGGGLDDNNVFTGKLDIRNNIVYNYGGRVTDGGAGQVNFVNNYYQPGPASKLKFALRANYEDNFGGQQTYYCAGNTQPPNFSASSQQVVNEGQAGACHAKITFSPAPTYRFFYDKEFFPSYVETQSADEARRRGISDAGASQPQIDDHDQRIRRETLSGTTTYSGSKSGIKGLIDNEKDAGGLESWPTATRESSWDANNDGIADWWDGSNGGVRGYTALDGYLNFMGDPHLFTSPSGSATYNLATQLAFGYTSPSFTATSTKALGTVSVSGSTLTYRAGATAGIDFVTVVARDSSGSTWTRSVGVAIIGNGTTPPPPPPPTTTTVPPPPPTTTTNPPGPTNPPGNCAALYGQCGGQGWTGPTCCSQGTCQFGNDWYSQCL